MNIRNKNASFLDGLTVFYDTFGKSFFSSKMKLTAFALSFFSIITFHIEARSQQVPAKAKVAVVKHSVTKKGKAKTKKTKKVVVVKKDTVLDIDPANVNSPLYNKN